MKKILFLGLLVVFAITSCSTTNAVKQTTRVIDGNWIIESVTYDGVGEFKSTLLQDVAASCFEGSNWNFVANNNRGTYNINNANCSTGERYFIWDVPGNKEMIKGDLLLKITDTKYKSESNAGYQLEITRANESNMTWSIPASVNGETVYVNMNFVKNNY
ncbi:lipocalin family protein [Nonlabens sp. Asnod3-A02]|uniref:lipocalin family protein n=1 Tax=Nonlabens sp. Asnod3-A02 TaxID=3160579 RepID=UPI003862F012